MKPIGAHGGGIPPGWDFPEARAAAEEGMDLWLLDSNLKLSPWDRIEWNFGFMAFVMRAREELKKKRCDQGGMEREKSNEC